MDEFGAKDNQFPTDGYIYIATNPAIPGMVKIGYTTKEPEERLQELSSSTSIPLPFELVAEFWVENPARVEAEIHARLFKVRVAPDREFFSIEPEKVESFVRKTLYGTPDPGEASLKVITDMVSHGLNNPEKLGVQTRKEADYAIAKAAHKAFTELEVEKAKIDAELKVKATWERLHCRGKHSNID